MKHSLYCVIIFSQYHVIKAPFPGYNSKVFMFPNTYAPNSHVYDYFPIDYCAIQIPIAGTQRHNKHGY